MKLHLACVSVLLCSLASGQDRTMPPSRLAITATVPKSTYKVREPIVVRLEALNRLHDKVRIPSYLLPEFWICSDKPSTGKPFTPPYHEGFSVDLTKKGDLKPKCDPDPHSFIFSGLKPAPVKDRSIFLQTNEFYGAELVIDGETEPGTYVLKGTYHGWDISKVTKEDLQSLKSEDSYIPVGDFEFPEVTITVEN